MTARHLLSLGAAASALSLAAPAVAQDAPSPDAGYEYAQPAPPAPPPVVFESQPVVQPLPTPAPVAAPTTQQSEADVYEEVPPPSVAAPPAQPYPSPQPQAAPPLMAPPPMAYPPMARGPMAYPPTAQGYPGPAGYPYPPQAWGPPQGFDRDGWLDDCHHRLGGGSSRHRHHHREADECGYYHQFASPAGYGYPACGCAYPAFYTFVPVLVAVPQRAVVHEYVTTEWVGVPTTETRTVVETKVVRQPVRSKVIPLKSTKPTKYVKER